MLRVFLVLAWLRWSLGVTSDFLNCDWDQDWRSFRRAFAQNARAGYPLGRRAATAGARATAEQLGELAAR